MHSKVGQVAIWLRVNWRWSTLNLSGFSVLAFVLTQGSTEWDAETFDPGLEGGKWAIRFLLTCLTMTPLNTFLGWSSALKLRKSAGLWAFAFAALHLFFTVKEDPLRWLSVLVQPYIALGFLGMLVLMALAVTSNRWAMRRLQKNWKRLHRLVYVAGMAVAFHSILATTASKKLAIRDSQAGYELQVYLAVMALLLAVRLPIVRRVVTLALAPQRTPRQADLPITPIVVHGIQLKPLPEIYAIENSIRGTEFVREPGRENAPTSLPLAGY